MPVPASINDLSTTESSNSPAGTETPRSADDYLRAHASFIAQLRDSKTGGDTFQGFIDALAGTGGAGLVGKTGGGTVQGFIDDLSGTGGAGSVGNQNGGTVQDALDAEVPPRSITRGGTGASTAAAALTNLGLIDLTNEIAVIATTALSASALGRSVAVTAATALNLELPDASVGAYLNVRVTRTSSALVAVFRTGVNIDGEINRVMLPGESALLMFTGSEWTKIGGVSRPIRGGAQRLTSQSISANTVTQVAFTSTFGSSFFSSFLFNAGTGNLLCQRPGVYQISANLAMVGAGIDNSNFQIAIVKNSVVPSIAPNALMLGAVVEGKSRIAGSVSGVFELVAGDGIGVIGFMETGTSLQFESNGTSIAPSISVAEIPSW